MCCDVSELRSAVEMLRSESLAELPDALIEEDLAELHRAVEQLEVERLRRLAEIDRRKLFERDGHLSTVSWLVSAFKVAWGVAREHVRLAKTLEEMPSARVAIEEGEVSLSSARVLASARDANPEAFANAEPTLVDAARMHTLNDLQRVAAFWRDAATRERAPAGESDTDRQRLHASKTFMGRVRADAGRRTPAVPASMRRAVIVRDRHCRFPGCDRPQSWCDAHHVVHWTNGGSTALHNLVLLCRRHHRLIHHRKFGVEIADGQPRFYRADGTVLTAGSRAPP